MICNVNCFNNIRFSLRFIWLNWFIKVFINYGIGIYLVNKWFFINLIFFYCLELKEYVDNEYLN